MMRKRRQQAVHTYDGHSKPEETNAGVRAEGVGGGSCGKGRSVFRRRKVGRDNPRGFLPFSIKAKEGI